MALPLSSTRRKQRRTHANPCDSAGTVLCGGAGRFDAVKTIWRRRKSRNADAFVMSRATGLVARKHGAFVTQLPTAVLTNRESSMLFGASFSLLTLSRTRGG
jgi:hypothetical protein